MGRLALSSWISIFFQLALLCSAQGREVPRSDSGDIKNDKDVYDITKHRVDNRFWIYANQAKDLPFSGHDSHMMDRKQETDDNFWIYKKKAKDTSGHNDDAHPTDRKQHGDNEFWIYAKKQAKDMDAKSMDRDGPDHSHHGHDHMDPSLHVFFTVEDLKIGKTMPLYFPGKPNPSKTPRLLPREQAESIPFSSSQLPCLLDYFSFSKHSPQAKAMAYTLEQCELEPIEGEVKFCATSLESMLDRARQIFGPGTESRALTTTYLSKKNTAKPLQDYTILETPKQVEAPKMIGCHPMPYPYAVFYCHSQLRSENRVFQVSLGGPEGERVEAVAVCHMDTSQWDRDHVSFRVLNIEPRSSPVCHFFPVDNLIFVPAQSSSHVK